MFISYYAYNMSSHKVVSKEPRREAFSKESHIMKVATQIYQRTHQANFEHEGS